MIGKTTSFSILSFLFIIISLKINLSQGQGGDSITANRSLSGVQTIVSSGNIFELGFFKTSDRKFYIGIWYKNFSPRTTVWVANRETPISNMNNAQLKILQGNLVLINESQVSIWSTNVNSTPSNSIVAVLGDDGNLVLRDGFGKRLWQSFDNPTDTWLPGGKLVFGKRTRTNKIFTSWKNSEDPSPGLFSLELDPNGRQYIIRWNNTEPYWTSGAWNGQTFSLIPEMWPNHMLNFSYIDNVNESYFTYSLYNRSIVSRFVMDVSGQVRQATWSGNTWDWNLFWTQPRQQCEVYAYCGPYGICNQNSLPLCNCLPGFKPKLETDWRLNDYSSGCGREIKLQQCGNGSAATGRQDRDRFLAKTQVRLPENYQNANVGSAGECEMVCLNNCSCMAYNYNDNKCLVWNGELLNLLQLSDDDRSGKTIYIRLPASGPQLSRTKKNGGVLKGAIVGSIVVVMVALAVIGIVIWRRRRNTSKSFLDGLNLDKISDIGVPSCSWESILVATEDFSDARKLGQGGFGHVYKGMLSGGQEIAVKRLSSCSVQGINEFLNEVVLIAKLQHRNLVRLLGYCIKENEKILLYEYMPNKSLDTIIFDQNLRSLLNWKKRFDIILGIAKGILYLHHDSRLRIIHRDLKTSNILLDNETNPKISDFGLARIVEGKGTEASTNKVVGTYGYMSPEYASNGLFSIKSDVFSFGVVVLEIISGKRNTGFYQSTEDLNLLGYVWRLWSENKTMDLVEPILLESCDKSEIVKCINVGLLCVEEDPNDRPTMSNVVHMLSGETTVFPVPNQPAFVMRKRTINKPSPSSSKPGSISNELTMSALQGR